jgi:hypothetical protein
MLTAPDNDLTGALTVRCGWCRTDLGMKACLPALDGQVTTTICPPCKVRLQYPTLLARIGRADMTDLIHLKLFELPQIANDGDRNELKKLIAARFQIMAAN